MSDRKLPDTSLAADRAMTYELRKIHHGKIISSLKEIGSGTYEEISIHAGMDKHAVGRRLNELEKDSIVWKPGTKKNTKSGRAAYIYQLTGQSQPKTEAEINYRKTGKNASQFASDLVKSTSSQPSLF